MSHMKLFECELYIDVFFLYSEKCTIGSILQ